MNYFQLLAVLSIDGCLLDLTPESHWALMATLYTIPEYEELARSEQTDKMALSSQNDEWIQEMMRVYYKKYPEAKGFVDKFCE